MPDVHTQTPMTSNRIDMVVKELNRLTRQKKRRANKRMADEVGKGEAEGGARRHAGRKVQQVDLPDGFQVMFKIRKTGVRKGMKHRYFVTPSGTALKSKRELDAYLELSLIHI